MGTANSASQYIVGSQTLKPGGSITVSGSVASLAGASSGTQASFQTSSCTATGLGAIIMSGFGVNGCVVSSSTASGSVLGTTTATARPAVATVNAGPSEVGSN